MAKFTKEEARENLMGKFSSGEGKTSLKLSERTISETLDTLMPLAGEEMELTAFIDDIAFKAISSMNGNFIHETSEFAKNYKPEPPKPNGMTEEQVKALIEQETKTYKDQISTLTSERDKAVRSAAIAAKKDELKLSKAWVVDFDNAVRIAELELTPEASADDVFNKAKDIFNATLAARGEEYKPQPSQHEPPASDFNSLAERRKKAKEEYDAKHPKQ